MLLVRSSVPSPARHLPPIVQRTTLQSVTITSRKENRKEEEQTNRTQVPPENAVHSLSPSISSPVKPPASSSLLATLLARKRSIVTVPASKDISPPLRSSSRPSPEHLPYTPHSPFHLFSYDLDEEPSPPAPGGDESNKTVSPRSEGPQSQQATSGSLTPLYFLHSSSWL